MKNLLLIILLGLFTNICAQNSTKFTTTGKEILGVWIEDQSTAIDYPMLYAIYKKISDGNYYYAIIDPRTKEWSPDLEEISILKRRKSGSITRYYIDYDGNPIGSGFEQWYEITSTGLKVYDAQGYIATYKKSKL